MASKNGFLLSIMKLWTAYQRWWSSYKSRLKIVSYYYYDTIVIWLHLLLFSLSVSESINGCIGGKGTVVVNNWIVIEIQRFKTKQREKKIHFTISLWYRINGVKKQLVPIECIDFIKVNEMNWNSARTKKRRRKKKPVTVNAQRSNIKSTQNSLYEQSWCVMQTWYSKTSANQSHSSQKTRFFSSQRAMLFVSRILLSINPIRYLIINIYQQLFFSFSVILCWVWVWFDCTFGTYTKFSLDLDT